MEGADTATDTLSTGLGKTQISQLQAQPRVVLNPSKIDGKWQWETEMLTKSNIALHKVAQFMKISDCTKEWLAKNIRHTSCAVYVNEKV